MAGLPQLNEEDMLVLDGALEALLHQSEATTGLIIDKGGPLITQRGVLDKFDTTTVSALAAGAFNATYAIAERLGETTLPHIYQQGEHHSLLISEIDINLLLIVVFRSELSVGAVKYYATDAITNCAAQMQRAELRGDGHVDLVAENLADYSGIFRKAKEEPPAGGEEPAPDADSS